MHKFPYELSVILLRVKNNFFSKEESVKQFTMPPHLAWIPLKPQE